jgi:hypothetical protein
MLLLRNDDESGRINILYSIKPFFVIIQNFEKLYKDINFPEARCNRIAEPCRAVSENDK